MRWASCPRLRSIQRQLAGAVELADVPERETAATFPQSTAPDTANGTTAFRIDDRVAAVPLGALV